ncbi:MAG TPA: sigma-70 family RNA polymerase sigma factor [Spirochaetia bacterium]|nr:sigma-70 family RNA polymerase sigma factor [Spirochaetia bacterium]
MKQTPIVQGSGRNSSKQQNGEPDPLSYYLKEVARYSLLNRNDEQQIGLGLAEMRLKQDALGKRFEAGEATFAQYAHQRAELERETNQIRDRLVTANLRLVVSIAKRFRNKGLTLMDIINEGNLGLIHAAQRYDYTKGCKFSTYATWWIRQAIEKSIADSGRTIRIPAHVVNHLRKIERESIRYFEEHGTDPSMAVLSAAVQVPEAKVRDYFQFLGDAASLDAPVEDERGTTMGELQAGVEYGEPFDWVYQSVVKTTFQDAFQVLDDRERQIVTLRYGLTGRGPLTLEEIGTVEGITRERVRQLLNAALGKLRVEPTIRHLGLRA